jgi:hypothetical protein
VQRIGTTTTTSSTTVTPAHAALFCMLSLVTRLPRGLHPARARLLLRQLLRDAEYGVQLSPEALDLHVLLLQRHLPTKSTEKPRN